MMRFSELLEHCITCIKTFNPVIKTIDSHADEYIANVSHSSFSFKQSLTFSFTLSDTGQRSLRKSIH